MSTYGDGPKRSRTVMSRMKQAGAVIQSRATGHSHLSMVIYQDKKMRQALHKVGTAKLELSKAVMAWIDLETNPMIKELASLLTELDRMWIRAHDEYNDQYSQHRNTFKEILKGAKLIDEKVRRTDACMKRIGKVKKQIEAAQKKQDAIKQTALETDLIEEEKNYAEAKSDLDYYKDQHERFKFQKFQEAYHVQSDSGTLLQSKCALISDAREALLRTCPKTVKTSFTDEAVAHTREKGQNILNDLSAALEIPRPRGSSQASTMASEKGTTNTFKRASSMEALSDGEDEEEAIYSPVPNKQISAHSLQATPSPVGQQDRPSSLGDFDDDSDTDSPVRPCPPVKLDVASPEASGPTPPVSPDIQYQDTGPVYGNVEDTWEPIYDDADFEYNPETNCYRRISCQVGEATYAGNGGENVYTDPSAYDIHRESLYANASIRLKKEQDMRRPSSDMTTEL